MTTKTKERQVLAVQRGVMLYKVDKTGLGAPVLGGPDEYQFSVADNGVGDYTLTLLDAASEENLDAFIESKTLGVSCSIGAVTKSSIQILCWSDLAQTTPAEGDFSLLVYKRKRADKS